MGLKSKLEIILAFILIVIIVIILCGSGAEAVEQREYILGEGETLWEVYEEYGTDMVWGEWLYEMERLNNKGGNETWYYGESIKVIVCK